MELLADERIRSKIVCLRTSLDCQFPDHWTFESVTSLILPWWQEHASLFLEQFPNMTRLCLTLVEFPLNPVTDFISSLDSLKYLELRVRNDVQQFEITRRVHAEPSSKS